MAIKSEHLNEEPMMIVVGGFDGSVGAVAKNKMGWRAIGVPVIGGKFSVT